MDSVFSASSDCFLFFKEFLSFGAAWELSGVFISCVPACFLLTNLALWAWSVKTLNYSASTLVLQSRENLRWPLKTKAPRSSWIKWAISEDWVHQLLCFSPPMEETISCLFLFYFPTFANFLKRSCAQVWSSQMLYFMTLCLNCE